MSNNILPYDDSSIDSIVGYASLLLNKSLSIVLPITDNGIFKGKGGFGQKVEKLYFKYEPNSKPEPDFYKVGMELKTTPLKKIKKGFVSKERLVFNIIDFEKEYKENFNTSSFWRKNQLLLLMFYLHEQEKLDIDYIFKIIRLWQFPATDLKIIKDDWTNIVLKIKNGKAHEISEGDTLYLGACTKGANNTSLRSQPFSGEMAMQRAFSLKSKYLNFIIEKSLTNEEILIDYDEYDKILNEDNSLSEPKAEYKRINLKEVEPIVKSIDEYKEGETFEDLVIKKFNPFIGFSTDEIIEKLKIDKPTAKNILNILSKFIMGVTNKKIEEFEKADVLMKTIKLENSGALKESMSFGQIQYKEIVNEEWEDSYWYNTIIKRFFFIIFQKDFEGVLRLKGVFFWTMPVNDIEVSRLFWEDTKGKITSNDFNHFIKISDKRICHVRPKAINSFDLMETPFGSMEKKKSYWLNSSYIKEVIKNHS
ncbi:MutH/Sau3AI family endonuclease [Flavobacterium sp. XS2P24]|uniref:MutH/Sau3AI family endonuclease n=1 Tax=Flavobacterium sp. XS2P24 TaxID=3041249 RepID=UPI0024A85A40|nr:MutH/Sau3AI family endonuclease [Flavobacterium sp. XS2P24]MDI6049351.1 MutH/Sau3AI family endonuclease [Flavobacterium sp. XS2P24]